MDTVEKFEKGQIRNAFAPFAVGDTVRVAQRITEGDKQRVQVFEGTVIGFHGGTGARRAFVVRKVSYGVGVEKVFPYHAPTVEGVDVVRRGRVRRAKLYYLRDVRGKAARIKELKSPDTRKKAAKRAAETPTE
jgi:large subunit ribosomal protein L19